MLMNQLNIMCHRADIALYGGVYVKEFSVIFSNCSDEVLAYQVSVSPWEAGGVMLRANLAISPQRRLPFKDTEPCN